MRPEERDDTDPLLQRFSTEDISFDNDEELKVTQNDGPAQVMDAIGNILEHAEHSLEELTTNDLLGSAIVRTCQDLANAVGHLARELEQQSEEDRRDLANACLQDVQETEQSLQKQQEQPSQAVQEFSQMTPEDIMSALAGCSTLLRDVEAGLRGIEQEEADEIADVAVTLARLFLASLQSFHSTIIHKEEQKRRLESDRIEILDDDEHETDERMREREKAGSFARKQRMDHLRVLWPPLGPAVKDACKWGKEEAIKQPVLAVALGITLWPAAVMTAFIGAPFLIADSLLQHTYNTFQDGPIIDNVEQGAAQLYQAGKLSLLTGRLIARQSLRVLNRQIERNGGIVPIAQNVAGMAVDRAVHPIETLGAVWNGLHWSFGMIQDNIERFTDPERQDAVAAVTEQFRRNSSSWSLM